MKVARIIEDTEELWDLLNEIKRLDEYTFMVCLLGAYIGARFRELRSLTLAELEKERLHLGTQIYKGTGRQVLITNKIKPYIHEFCDKQPNKKKSILEKADGTYVSFVEAGQIVEEAASTLKLKGVTITSFRKTFGHKICHLLSERWIALDATGFKINSQTNLDTMFDLKESRWE